MPTHFELHPLPPFRLDLTVWALRRRPSNLVDRWEDGVYRRTLVVGGGVTELAVTQHGTPGAPRLHVHPDRDLPPESEQQARRTIAWILSPRLDLTPFYAIAVRHPQLGPLAERFRGLKPPRFPDLFEAAANAVAFQQVSMASGVAVLNRLTERAGRRDGAGAPAFPRADDVLLLEPADLRALGFSAAKGRALLELAHAVATGQLSAEALQGLPDDEARARLLPLRGIGPWSADYLLLRGLGRLALFPPGDAGAGARLLRWLGLEGGIGGPPMQHALAAFHPYAGMVYFHLLLVGLSEAGLIDA